MFGVMEHKAGFFSSMRLEYEAKVYFRLKRTASRTESLKGNHGRCAVIGCEPVLRCFRGLSDNLKVAHTASLHEILNKLQKIGFPSKYTTHGRTV